MTRIEIFAQEVIEGDIIEIGGAHCTILSASTDLYSRRDLSFKVMGIQQTATLSLPERSLVNVDRSGLSELPTGTKINVSDLSSNWDWVDLDYISGFSKSENGLWEGYHDGQARISVPSNDIKQWELLSLD